jgi:hypothetical protein
MLAGTGSQTARYGTLLQPASTPTVKAALPAASCGRRKWTPLGRCSAGCDSGRDRRQRDYYPKDASFRRAPYLRLDAWKTGTWGSLFKIGIG